MIFRLLSISTFSTFFLFFFLMVQFISLGGPVYLSEDYVLLFAFFIFFCFIYRAIGGYVEEYFLRNSMEFRESFLSYFEVVVGFSLEVFDLVWLYFNFFRILKFFTRLLGFYFRQVLFFFNSFSIFEIRFAYRIFVNGVFKVFLAHSRKNFKQRWTVLFFRFRRRRLYMDEFNWLIAGFSYRRDFIGSWLTIPNHHFSKQSKLPLFWLEYRKNIYETPWFKSYKFRTWTL